MDAGPSQQPSEASKSSLSSWLPWSSSSSSSTPTPSTWDTPSTSQSTPTEPVMVADDTPSGTAVALDDSDQTSVSKRYNLRIPTSLLVLTPSAAVVGLFIGMRRGGEKARLRFLAENAHRQPTTVQGWVSKLADTARRAQRLLSMSSPLGTHAARLR